MILGTVMEVAAVGMRELQECSSGRVRFLITRTSRFSDTLLNAYFALVQKLVSDQVFRRGQSHSFPTSL